MLNKLRLKLTLTCATITTTILIIMVLFALTISEKELNSRSKLTLESQLNTLTYYLQTNNTISHLWLAQLESSNGLVVNIEENHHPLLFKGSYRTQTERSELITLANDIATDIYGFNFYVYRNTDHTLHAVQFELRTSNKEHFLVATASIKPNQTSYQLTLLKDMKYDDAQILNIRLFFIGLTCVCSFLLTLFSWWFAGKAIHPIEISQRKQKEFIAAASHELRSPLAVLQTSASALSPHNAEENRFIHSIMNECQRMARLVSDLLLLTNIDAKANWSLHPKDTEVDTLLLEIYDLYYPNAKKNHHTLRLNLPNEPIPTIWIDRQRLQQAIVILLDNAISYTPSGTEINLTLLRFSHYLCIKVIDNGPGIIEEHKAHIFDRFYRVDSSRHHKEHYGLGLSIAYEIMQLHHGKLKLEDTPLGGCTFVMTLPLNSASQSISP